MLIHNRAFKRCLVLSRNEDFLKIVNDILTDQNLHVDNFFERKAALKCFLQYRHHLLLIEDAFLPRYPYRLLQFFKMAHRTPGVIIFNFTGKDLTGYSYLNEEIIRIITPPINKDRLEKSFNQISTVLSNNTKRYFKKDFLIQFVIAFPLVILTIYFIIQNFIE